jgi:hypothetical protein
MKKLNLNNDVCFLLAALRYANPGTPPEYPQRLCINSIKKDIKSAKARIMWITTLQIRRTLENNLKRV